VRSLAVQANAPQDERQMTVFEVLTRHLLFRLTHNEALGEEIPARLIQVVYMLALPGVLVALFLVMAYHPPKGIGPRPYWSQVSDHYIYTVYSFVVMGVITIFEWELLFPDLLDVFVLSALPIKKQALLRARLLALGIFLGLAVVGVNILGAAFFPVLAELHLMWIRHTAAHLAATVMAGTFAAALFVALQGLMLCVLGRKILGWISPVAQAASMVALLTVLFLTPLIAGNIEMLFATGGPVVRWFPPFWFLGVYEFVMHGGGGSPIWGSLAGTAALATAGALVLAAATYPLAYARRVKQLVEGVDSRHKRSVVASGVRTVLHSTLLRSAQVRAVYHFISQTILRVPRLRLYLTMYAGVGLALAISGAVLLAIQNEHIRLRTSEIGLRAVMPLLVFLLVVGMRTAMDAPVGLQGSWLFMVVHGRPLQEHLRAVFLWVSVAVSATALVAVVVVELLAPASMHRWLPIAAQVVVAVGMTVLLTRVFLLRIREIPFTVTRVPSTRDLPISFVRYMVIFPWLVLYVVGHEAWVESSVMNLALTVVLLAGIYLLLGWMRTEYLKRRESDSAADDSVLVHRLGLQE
jgi:hypothetical protein